MTIQHDNVQLTPRLPFKFYEHDPLALRQSSLEIMLCWDHASRYILLDTQLLQVYGTNILNMDIQSQLEMTSEPAEIR